ncbi:hypothetical protein BJ508DRAFT_416519 [Ascobolus immersus RN42]|uniref:Uncharacterized protein n=1 Tax=Ascobolus immersus RN42 TaxID=1160509 RepID=A0A3N4HZD2_ASCIM|nr:hypothetical protein BJ508DRAFT_416519 [Ascobolus immersus RN42]
MWDCGCLRLSKSTGQQSMQVLVVVWVDNGKRAHLHLIGFHSSLEDPTTFTMQLQNVFFSAFVAFIALPSSTLAAPKPIPTEPILELADAPTTADTRRLSISASTVKYLDSLYNELQPGHGKGPLQLDDPRYDDLFASLSNSSYTIPTHLDSISTTSRPPYVAPSYPVFNDEGTLCETSTASPPYHEFDELMSRARATLRTKYCDVDNDTGSRCTKQICYKSACFGICGDWSDWEVQCGWILHLWESIGEECVRGGDKKKYEGFTGGQRRFVYKATGNLKLRLILH